MIRKKVRRKKNELPSIVLVHYREKGGDYNFEVTLLEKTDKVKEKLINAGMTEVETPSLDAIRENILNEEKLKLKKI